MGVQAHMTELVEKHRELDLQISAEIQRPGTDTLTINELKRKKLRIKEELERLRSPAH
jgi:hypothetical protein